ncbi:MAG: glycosyltransferase, partial [Ilumatobacteraceae bacterium]
MTNTPQRYLLPMWDGGGTVAPGLGVARRLIARGHAVHVIADPTIAAQADQAGCTFTPWSRAPHRAALDRDQDLLRDWETANPLVMLSRVRDRLMAGPAEQFATDTAEAIDVFGPDVVAPDYL